MTSCPHCRVAPFDSGLMRCDLCDTWSHLLSKDMACVCLAGSWAHGHGMATLQERIDARNAALSASRSGQMTLWG